jgi:hypothetical protein
VKHLLEELDYWYPLFVCVFMPFLFYFGIVTYYNCFILTDAYQPRDGFTHGSNFAKALRFLILIATGLLLWIEGFQLRAEGFKKYF